METRVQLPHAYGCGELSCVFFRLLTEVPKGKGSSGKRLARKARLSDAFASSVPWEDHTSSVLCAGRCGGHRALRRDLAPTRCPELRAPTLLSCPSRPASSLQPPKSAHLWAAAHSRLRNVLPLAPGTFGRKGSRFSAARRAGGGWSSRPLLEGARPAELCFSFSGC